MTKEKHEIKAEIRTVLGKKVRALRRLGFTPSTIYGHDFEPISIQFNSIGIEKLYEEVGESGLVQILLDDKKLPILFKNVQYHPVTDVIMHVDCHHVNLNEKITAMVPIELIGESPATKLGNTLLQVSNEIEVECLPNDLPESIEVDVSNMNEVGDQITVADLNIDRKKVEVLSHEELVVATIEAQRAEEEEIVEETTPTVAPATSQLSEEELATRAAEKKADKEKEDKE